jgi:predicted GTPase
MAAHEDSPTDMVLVMGVTGAGKSYLINKLKEGATVEGDGLESSE